MTAQLIPDAATGAAQTFDLTPPVDRGEHPCAAS